MNLQRMSRRTALLLVPLLTALAPGAPAPTPVLATPNHAHHHYLIGVRAYAGTRHAAMLHLEASSEDLDLALARENATDMERLAAEIQERLTKLESMMSSYEKQTIGAEMAAMKEHAQSARKLAAELGQWIDEAASAPPGSGTPAPVPAALRERIAKRARALFAEFNTILANHKQAEKKLGIPVPPDPSAP